eukprot:scaffold60696_cov41-Attheya_sp.AAC.1
MARTISFAAALLVALSSMIVVVDGFVSQMTGGVVPGWRTNTPSFHGRTLPSSLAFHRRTRLEMSDDNANDDDESPGTDLSAEFLKIAASRNIELDDEDLYDEDEDTDDDDEFYEENVAKELDFRSIQLEDENDDDDEEEEEEEEMNIPQGAINAFLGYDATAGDAMAGNVTLTNDQIYGEMKDRLLDTAGGFVDYVRTARGSDDDDDEDDDNDDDDEESEKGPKVYKTPSTVPDSGLTAGEVVTTVLEALLHNDVPKPNRGIEVLFGYSSPYSQIMQEDDLTPDEYSEFLKDQTDYKVLFDHEEVVIDKGDYSFDKKKAFFTARLRTGPGPNDFVAVNFILSTPGHDEDDCWLVDSMLIRPESMRRRRRR